MVAYRHPALNEFKDVYKNNNNNSLQNINKPIFKSN